MNGIIDGVIKSILYSLGADGVFIALLAVAIVAFVVNLLLAIFVVGYGVIKRLWQPIVSLFCVCIQGGFCACLEIGYGLTFVLAGLCALLTIPLLVVREKNFVVDDKQKEFVRFIDNEIESTLPEKTKPLTQAETNSTLISDNREIEGKVQEKTSSDFDLDFEHVKNVIARLDYFGLKESDKRQVKELENALLSAEKGEFNLDVKSRINDGLGALLKIMSKYGV